MNKYKSWLDIQMNRKNDIVNSFQSLRPGCADVRQFMDDGNSRMVVQGTKPYGDLATSSNNHVKELFETVETGIDYTIFQVPEVSLSLKALTLGTGHRNAEMLNQTYSNIGRAVSNVFKSGVKAPELTINDIAVGRVTGAVYLMPKIEFIVEEKLEQAYAETSKLIDSLDEIRSMVGRAAVARFGALIIDGLNYE